MIDILDVILAKKMAVGEADSLIVNAKKAIQDANAAIDTINTITDEAQAANGIATAAAETATAASESAEAAAQTYDNLLAVIDESMLADFSDVIEDVVEQEVTTLTTALNNLNSAIESINTKIVELEEEIDEHTSLPSFQQEDVGYITSVQNDTTLGVSSVKEDDLIQALVKLGIYHTKDAVGLIIDYEAKTFERVQDAESYTAGADFDKYPMYGGRKRCNVNADGQIVAWYGDNSYRDDGTNGQVMIYQPKFYYQRVPLKTENNRVGKTIRRETVSITSYAQPGFKIHPAFVDTSGNVLDYILLPAYESCYYDTSAAQLIKDDTGLIDFSTDKLFSCAGAKPVSGVNNSLTITNAETMANNIGSGWHITNAAMESANQMLALIEFGTLNGQIAIENGLTSLPNLDAFNCASQTGSTASLGNASGIATSTINITNGITNEYNTAGRRAVSYRGMENPWGNMWRFIGGLTISGNGATAGGVPYICTDFNYTPFTLSNNYISAGFCLSSNNGWISGMGYGNESCDWLFMPSEANDANSVLPVGDNIWITTSLNGIRMSLIGGNWQQQDSNGLFYYACDNTPDNYSRSASARIMHIPTFNSTIYNNNITAWTNQMQG